MSSLADKVCIVTGGASGIGRATVLKFAAEGAHVVIADRADATDFAAEVGGLYVAVDVTDEASVEQLVAAAVAWKGHLDVMVNNVGYMTEETIDEVDRAIFDRHIAVNALGVLYGMKYGARVMSDGGAFVNTSSVSGLIGAVGYGAYGASKAAVISLTQTAAIELGGRGIRVNCICPASVETPMLQAQSNGDLEREISRIASPLGRTIQPEQVAEVIAFLASPASSALTGQALRVEAGMTVGYSNEILEAIVTGIGGLPE
ncbi:MAG: SDR family oxidoreductase [Nocardioidaceae bacterium]